LHVFFFANHATFHKIPSVLHRSVYQILGEKWKPWDGKIFMIFSAAIREELLVGTNFNPGLFTADNTITGPVPPWLEKGVTPDLENKKTKVEQSCPSPLPLPFYWPVIKKKFEVRPAEHCFSVCGNPHCKLAGKKYL
jgi:hypothetical protein